MEDNLDKANRVLKEIELSNRQEQALIVGPEKGKIIVETIRRIKPKRVLEVGTLAGYSTLLMAKELSPDAKVVTIEIDAHEAEVAKDNLEQAGILANVEILLGDALRILPQLKDKFDLVFLDANKEENMDYLILFEKNLHKGSVIIADNAGAMAYKMEDYLSYVRSSGEYESKYVPVNHDGLEISIKL